ncbi:MAG: YgiQ family radical SAM protein [Lachnospiraceae bacterium]|nr:YgiQ family radical SAM protein [Lachnospiraceae bacterium]
MPEFLPISRADMEAKNISQLDFVLISGDAYVDHPSFGHAVISRILVANGYSVGIIAQPDWRDESSIAALGRPRLAFLVSAGNMDSMVNHYYVSLKKRESDAYSPGGAMGKRPDRATAAYGNLIRRTFKEVPIIIGGIEASLRRFAHYDYWSNSFKRSILLDSQADLLIYGMGEKAIIAVAEALNSGILIKDINFIKGTVFKTKDVSLIDAIKLPDYEEMKANPLKYASSFKIQSQNTDSITAKTLLELYPNNTYVVKNPPQEPLTAFEMDAIYDLPYARTYHPVYEKDGGVPAIKEIKFSLTSSRGCFGACSFCALNFHQGRRVQSRSHESLIKEAELFTGDPDFKGYIHDVGGPTANFRKPSCEKQLKEGACAKRQCLYPEPCPNLEVSHEDYLSLLRKLRKMPGIKKVFIRSGLRFDYLLLDKNEQFFHELAEFHISGQLKVAPEHIALNVLKLMGKPAHNVYLRFAEKFQKINQKLGKKQFLIPYLMSSHPGSTLKDAVALAEYLHKMKIFPEQVQDFYPTPGSLSTVMYFTGIDPRSGEKVYVCRNPHEKAMQRALIQYRNPQNHGLVKEALFLAGREDLIGFGANCLIKPRLIKNKPFNKTAKKPQSKVKAKKKTIRNVHKRKQTSR